MRTPALLLSLLFVSGTAMAEEPAPDARAANAPTSAAPAHQATGQRTAATAKTLSGMSVLGNQEAPKSLVIVPWKSARIGDPVGLQRNVDDSRQPVDREVFMRELDYYELRTR